MKCVELFTGCGGLAMGLSRAGFSAQHMAEWDGPSVRNVLHNRERGIQFVSSWPIHQQDVRGVDWTDYRGVELVAGGPPCQPFSIGGRHRGHEDERDMWPEAVRAVREIAPEGFIFENVRGLTREAFSGYLKWVTSSLARPQLAQGKTETREDHLSRLETTREPATYRVAVYSVNAADYGAAQKRHRVLILGVRTDLSLDLPKLTPTHSLERLLWDQWISGDYWKRHGIAKPSGGPTRCIRPQSAASLNRPSLLRRCRGVPLETR